MKANNATLLGITTASLKLTDGLVDRGLLEPGDRGAQLTINTGDEREFGDPQEMTDLENPGDKRLASTFSLSKV